MSVSRSKALCHGSGLSVVYWVHQAEPLCAICGKSLGRAGRKGNRTTWSPHTNTHVANRHFTDLKGKST